MVQVRTFGMVILSPGGFRDTLEPTGFNTFKAAVTFYELLPAHVNRAIAIIKGNTPSTTDEKHTY